MMPEPKLSWYWGGLRERLHVLLYHHETKRWSMNYACGIGKKEDDVLGPAPARGGSNFVCGTCFAEMERRKVK